MNPFSLEQFHQFIKSYVFVFFLSQRQRENLLMINMHTIST